MLAPAFAPAQDAAPKAPTKVGTVEGITEFKFDNGLRLLLIPDASKPVVTVNMTVFVGSRHEGYGETGMAHLLEHMLFKGTPTFPNVPKALRDHGAARFNGTTWVDRTNYYETMQATDENLEFGIQLEADRLMNSYVKREDLLSEMTVVRNEFESGENNPESILSQRMMAVSFEWHNYGKSTIGNRSDIERVPIENLQAFYRKYYRVDNTMLVVAGRFDEKKVLSLVGKYFGAIKKPATPMPKTYTEEPAQDGERFVTLRRVGTVGAVGAVYHVPAGAHPDYPALEVLEDILTSAPSGRLYKALVESKMASRVSGSIYPWHDPGVIEFLAKVEAPGVELARDAMLGTLEALDKAPVTEEEVARSKTTFKRISEQILENTDAFAVRLSEWAAAGDWRLFFLHRDRMEKVTPEDVNRVAAKYLTRTNRTTGVYIPTKTAERTDIPETPKIAELLNGYEGRASVTAGESIEPTPAALEKRVVRGVDGGLKTAILPKKTRNDVIVASLSLRYGNPDSLKGYATSSEFLGAMMKRGTDTRSRQQISDELDKLGARVQVSSSSPGLLSVTIRVKKANLDAVLVILEDVLKHPTFPAGEFEILRREQLEQYRSGKTEPQMLASRELSRKLSPYPKDDVRYVPTLDEKIAELEAMKVEDVKKLYADQVSGQSGELAAVGDFDPKEIVGKFQNFLTGWTSKVKYERIARPQQEVKPETIRIETPDKANAIYLAAIPSQMTDADPDYAAVELANFLLGEAPLASRLSNRVRGEEGLSYGIGSSFTASSKDEASRVMVYAITNPKNMGKVETAIAEEIARFLKDGPTPEEISEGRKAILKKMEVERSDDGQLLSELAGQAFLGRTFAHDAEVEKRLKELSTEDIMKASKKAIDPAKMIRIEAGDFAKPPTKE